MHAESRRQLSKFTAIFAGGTMISRVLGLVRDIVIAKLIPTMSRDSFLVAFFFPNMLRDIVGEGASNAAFVPILSETLEKDKEAAFRELTSALMSAMIVVLGVLTVAGVVFMPYVLELARALESVTGVAGRSREDIAFTASLTRWTFPYIFFIGLTVFQMGPLFILRHYSTPSWSPALLNVFMIVMCFGVFRNAFPDPAYALVVGVWLGGISQFLVQYVALGRRTGAWLPNFRLRHPGVRAALWLLVPVIIGQAAGEVNKLVNTLFAYSLAEGTVTALQYANRLVQLPLAIFGIAIAAAILPSISRSAARMDTAEVRGTLIHGLRQSYFLICPAVVALIFLPGPIVRLLFQRGYFDAALADKTAVAVAYYASGLLFFAWVKILVSGFYAIKNTKTPVIIASGSMLLNVAMNFAIVRRMGYQGLALSTTVSYAVNFLLVYTLLGKRYGKLWDAHFVSTLVRVTLAGAGMAVVLVAVHRQVAGLWPGDGLVARMVETAAPLAVACAAYLTLCALLRVGELKPFVALLRKRAATER